MAAGLLAGIGYVGLERTFAVCLGRDLENARPMHLWLLEYLIVLYVLAALAIALVPLVLTRRRGRRC